MNVVCAVLVAIRAVIGVVLDTRWYRNGTPTQARFKGLKRLRVDCACARLSIVARIHS